MPEKTTLKDIAQINKILASKEYETIKEFNAYIEIIKEYIDDTFFKKDAIIEKLVEYCENSGRYLDIKFKKPSGIELNAENIQAYMSNTKKAIEKAIFIEDDTLNHSIFIEIKSIFRYFLEKTYEISSLTDYETLYTVNTIEFHQQNESFKYLYTIFDKFTYIAKHLNDKYCKKIVTNYNGEALKFSQNFLKEISFLTKSALDYQKLSDTIEQITYSNAWHYIRKLRNSIEHDFVDPSYKYNICFSLELLFIIIGRIMLSLNLHMQSEIEIRKTLDSLKQFK
ncbi:hypothetical protein [Spiroplasma diminutum]|uniref:Uncharacterized protein n=1 Tax=Spiroplasma diminutum CUAS-1 TaxID=1276221 RepID=S5M1K4_9MOLU|nr:hypothetical protein [Spiroplasma diminutum]AGR41937.1 hypothetical protein SDIMI_v3c02330 [Spiroplasma diminutum CUAS-1]